jgi:hypothetical protein
MFSYLSRTIFIGPIWMLTTWDERVEAVRIECSPGRLNDFIAVQLSEGAKQEILQWPK